MNTAKIALHHKDSDELLGYVVKDAAAWQAQTVFGYVIERTETQAAAEAVLREQGQDYLKGIWQYYDKDDYDWYACTIKDATEQQVIVIRTNDLGYQDPKTVKFVTIKAPSEEKLVKSS